MPDDVTPPGKNQGSQDDPLNTKLDDDSADIIVDTPDKPEKATSSPVKDVDQQKIEDEFGPPPATTSNNDPLDSDVADKPKMHKNLWAWIVGLSTTQKIVYGTLLAVALIVIGICTYLLLKPGPTVAEYPTYRAPTPTTVASKLTGLQVEPEINQRQVTGVMIENSVFARPQSGLNQAGIVFEAIAEAGITRFLALFQDTQSDHIGPVRSVRPYYVQWCQAFDCALAHVGGSPQALSDIKKYGVKNLDQFAGAAYFHRVTNRYAPHNVYTSQADLTKYENKQGYKSSEYTGFEHMTKELKVAAANITTKSIDFNYPGTSYDVHYTYKAKTNDYARSEGGKPHNSVDEDGKVKRNTPKVVVALVIPYSIQKDGYHSNYDSVGSGTVYVFQNGDVIKGTWTRKDRDSQFILTDKQDQVIKLVPGQAWISVLGQNKDVTYK